MATFTKAPRFFIEQLGTVEAIDFLSQLSGATEEALVKAMNKFGEVVEKSLKDNIASDASDTGRLAASIGHYDPNYVRHEYDDPEFGRSTPADAYYQEPTKKGGQWSIIIGTNVWYAAALEWGFPRKGSGSKPVKLKNGMWRRLKDAIPRRPAGGWHWFDNYGVESKKELLNLYLGAELKKAGWDPPQGVNWKYMRDKYRGKRGSAFRL